MNWEVVATFDNAVAAEMAKNLLADNGVAALVMNDETIDNAWARNSALGGIKVCVREPDLARAEVLLELGSHPLETDAEIEAAVTERPEIATALGAAPEPFDDRESDRIVQRAFVVGVLGLFFLPARLYSPDSLIVFNTLALALLCIPIQLYSLFLLLKLRSLNAPIRKSNRWKVWTALIVNVPLWSLVVIPAMLILNQVSDPTAPKWKNTRFTGFGDHVLTVDFPEDYGHAIDDDVATALGPMKVRSFGRDHNGRSFLVWIGAMNDKPDDPRAALKTFVDREYAKMRIESTKDAAFGDFPALEMTAVYRSTRTGQSMCARVKVVLVDSHVLVLTADVPNDAREGRDVERFFSSARLQ